MLESILLVVLLVAALFIIVAVLLQKGSDEGLSGSITGGGADTFYGKDKASHTERTLFIFTIIVAIIFVVAVLAVYVIQPDFYATYSLDDWKTNTSYNGYTNIFK